MNDAQLRSLVEDAHRGLPFRPFSHVLQSARERAPAPATPRSWLPLAAAALIAITALAALQAPEPEPRIASPLHGWRAPTDFLLASRPNRRSTGFLLHTPGASVTASPQKGTPE